MTIPFVVGDSVRFDTSQVRNETPLADPVPIGFNANSPMTVVLTDEETGMVDVNRDGMPFGSFEYLRLVKVASPYDASASGG